MKRKREGERSAIKEQNEKTYWLEERERARERERREEIEINRTRGGRRGRAVE